MASVYTPPDTPGFNASAYLTANPDVQQAWAAQSTVSGFASKFPTSDVYAAWHYQNYGQSEGRDPTGARSDTPGVVTTAQSKTDTTNLINTTQDTTNNVLTQTGTGVDNVVKQVGTGTAQVVNTVNNTANTTTDTLNAGSTTLNTLVTGLTTNFNDQVTNLVNQMNSNAGQQSAAIAKAITDAQDRVGQNARAPNYARALEMNKKANSGGLSSTNLTGPNGVAATALPLGQATLLGGT